MSSNQGLRSGEEEKEGRGRSSKGPPQVSDVQPGVRAEGPDESDLQSGPVSSEKVKAGDVHRSGKSSKQTRPRRLNPLSIGGLAITRHQAEGIRLMTSDGEILIGLVWSKPGKARLVINAPKSVGVDRVDLRAKESAA